MSFKPYPKYKESGVEWLGRVPEHWEVMRLGYLASRIGSGKTPSGGADNYCQQGVLFLRSQNIYDEGLRLEDVVYITQATDDGMPTSRVLPGDILLNITGASLGRTCVVPDDFEAANVNQHVCIIRLRDASLRAFLSLLLKSAGVKSQLDYIQNGAAREGLNFSMVSSILCPLPSPEERDRVATFLDHETAKIDALIAEQQRLIELLQEKRQAVISHAVTKGLNPDAPMKDSGIEWLGEVPEHWDVTTLGRFTTSKCDGPFGSGLKSEHYTDSGVRVVRLQNIRSEGFSGNDEAFIDAAYFATELNGHDVLVDDLLIAGLGDERNTVGRACVAPIGIEPAMVKADCFRFRLDRNRAIPSFVAVALSAGAPADAGLLSSGSTRSRIPLSVMGTRRVALPPLEEQAIIVVFVDREVANIAALIAEAERSISLLQERRSALISAAVTGQIDVRGFSTGGTEAA